MTSDLNAAQMPTYALTIRQPYAWAIFNAGKDVENRSWKPSRPFRLLVHAGKTYEPSGIETLREMGHEPPEVARLGGGIIGAVDVVDWEWDASESPWAVRGHWHWHLKNPIPALRPIVCRGMPALFHPPADWPDHFAADAVA